MKRLFSTCLMIGLLTCTAGAAQVGTIRNDYPGDTEAQAQMLYDIGLFRGTEKGFELDKPMTRAEAAAMLTRLLGAEKTALSGTWKHPFTDVPQWADKYVGWLYQNGLTKGTAATKYGAEEKVTCDQYCIFLTRAHLDWDSYSGTGFTDNDEVAQCDEEGFIRGDAVSLSARLLEQNYGKNGYGHGWSMAQKLIHDGVFTTEQFKKAAWDVLPRIYDSACTYDENGNVEGSTFACTISGVPVAQRDNIAVEYVFGDNADSARKYAGSYYQEGQDYTLYRLDEETLALTEIAHMPNKYYAYLLGSAGETDYFLLNDQAAGEALLCSVRGITFKVEKSLTNEQSRTASAMQSQQGCILAMGGELYKLSADGVSRLENISGELFHVTDDGVLVTQNMAADSTEITAYSFDGTKCGSFTVQNAYTSDDEQIRQHYAPQLTGFHDDLLWGSAGLYRVVNGALTQITETPAYSVQRDKDGSYVAATCDKAERLEYYEAAIEYLAGNSIIRIAADGSETVLLPACSLTIDSIETVKNDAVRFTTVVPTEPRMMGRYGCVLKDGKVSVKSATSDILYMISENAVQNEQKRLDELGIGLK